MANPGFGTAAKKGAGPGFMYQKVMENIASELNLEDFASSIDESLVVADDIALLDMLAEREIAKGDDGGYYFTKGVIDRISVEERKAYFLAMHSLYSDLESKALVRSEEIEKLKGRTEEFVSKRAENIGGADFIDRMVVDMLGKAELLARKYGRGTYFGDTPEVIDSLIPDYLDEKGKEDWKLSLDSVFTFIHTDKGLVEDEKNAPMVASNSCKALVKKMRERAVEACTEEVMKMQGASGEVLDRIRNQKKNIGDMLDKLGYEDISTRSDIIRSRDRQLKFLQEIKARLEKERPEKLLGKIAFIFSEKGRYLLKANWYLARSKKSKSSVEFAEAISSKDFTKIQDRIDRLQKKVEKLSREAGIDKGYIEVEGNTIDTSEFNY